MSYAIFFLHKADVEAQEAAIYYEDEKAGLGLEFLAELETVLKKLADNPQFYSYISSEKTIRCLSFKRFPYQLIFEISGNKVIILSVHHRRRKKSDI